VLPTVVVNGTSVQTDYGPVQVQPSVRGGRILSATAIDYPRGGGRDSEINGYALPALQQGILPRRAATSTPCPARRAPRCPPDTAP
jgi:hypothetical protein